MPRQVYILSAARTPIGAFLGCLKDVSAPQLGAAAIRAALDRAAVGPLEVEEVLMGNVLQAGIGQAPARQAALGAGISVKTGAVTVNKVCGSGMKAVTTGADAIVAGEANLVVAGGMESMSRAPYLLDRARCGYRMGNAEMVDCMLKDGLVDVYHNLSMGAGGEAVAEHYGISRDEQDNFAIETCLRARAAWERGAFAGEVAPVDGAKDRAGDALPPDECLRRFDQDKLRRLKPAFKSDGTITAATSSPIADGAAALVLASEEFCRSRHGVRPLARIVAHAQVGVESLKFGFAPSLAIRKVLEKAALQGGDIDLFEINEAFAAVAIGAMRELNLETGRVNINGGAVALGHPIGATGARLLVTLAHSLHERKGRYGLAALCIGGGEGMAVIVERA